MFWYTLLQEREFTDSLSLRAHVDSIGLVSVIARALGLELNLKRSSVGWILFSDRSKTTSCLITPGTAPRELKTALEFILGLGFYAGHKDKLFS